MDFNHSEERQMLADTLTRWVMQDYPLTARLEASASETGFSRDKLAALADLGVIGALFTEEQGGFGGAGFDLSVVFEAVGRGLIVEPLLQTAVLAGGILAASGCAQDMIDALIAGKKLAALAHFEADDGCEVDHIATTATKAAEGWVLNGQKAVVRNTSVADLLVVSARTSGKIGDKGGISLFLVPAGTAGLTIRDYQTIDGGRAAEVGFSDLALPASALIAAEGQGGDLLEQALGRGILCLCAEAVGLMDAIKDMTIDYIQTRKQFGVPIGKFQALQHRMAEMLLEIEQARSAVINAAALVDTSGVDRERALSAAKVTIGQVGTLVAEESIQLHGGIGMTWEHALGHFAKRLTMIGHELGDEDYHLMRYVRLGAAA